MNHRSGLVALVASALVLSANPPGYAAPDSGSPVAGPAAAAEAAKPNVRGQRWVGYQVRTTRTASGRWIGGYRVGGAKAYRIDPNASRKSSASTRYRRVSRTANLAGKRGPSRLSTARAAYILSRYGTEPNKTQAAAVDAAVLHLLRGGKWKLQGRHGRKRIRQAGDSYYVRDYARQMLKTSKQEAGAARLTLTATAVEAGSASRVTATLTNARTGAPLAGFPVAFAAKGQQSTQLYTNARGVAQTTIVAVQGATPVQATAKTLPAWRLAVRAPKRKRASRVALAGVRQKARATTTIVAAGPQQVTLSHPTLVTTKGSVLGGSYVVSGGLGTRSVSFTSYGPFTTSATCSGTVAYSGSRTVTTPTASGTLPAWKAQKSGYYRWNVTAGANAYSKPASACGTVLRVQAPSTVTSTHAGATTVKLGAKFGVDATVGGFDRTENGHTLTARLYGPYKTRDAVTCGDAKHLPGRSSSKAIAKNGTYAMTRVSFGSTDSLGWYGWKSSVSSGEFITGASTGCRSIVRVVR